MTTLTPPLTIGAVCTRQNNEVGRSGSLLLHSPLAALVLPGTWRTWSLISWFKSIWHCSAMGIVMRKKSGVASAWVSAATVGRSGLSSHGQAKYQLSDPWCLGPKKGENTASGLRAQLSPHL